jgi:two-component system, OmpR family, phosphate regulon response regulator OmpR
MAINEKSHILIVDDDVKIIKLLSRFLESKGFLVSSAYSAEEAKEHMKHYIFDLIILDVMMPVMSGTEFAKSVKGQDLHVPIILLTALSETEDKIDGLSSGADDYMTKPFEPKELLLRISNLIEIYGYKNVQEQSIRFSNDSKYNKKSKEFTKDGETILLSSTEVKLLDLLIDNNSIPLSREKIASLMNLVSERSVDVQVTRLRNKIEQDSKQPKIIRTIRNQGYALYK